MTKRASTVLRLSGAALVVALGLSSCSVVDTPAASLGDATLSDADLTALVEDLAERPEFGQYTIETDSGAPVTARADAVRNLITLWISSQVLVQEIERRGFAVGQADLDEMDSMLSRDGAEIWSAATDRIRDFYLPVFAAQEVFARVVTPDDDELEALYLQGGLASGVSCPRHILLDTEEDALQVLADLEAGADFAQLAAERSIDTFTGANGGIVEPVEGVSCFTTADFQQNIIPEFVDAVLAAEIDVPTGPFPTQFGWHVVIARPFAEVVEGVRGAIGGSLSTEVQQELITSTTAQVASKYGTWVPELGAVLPVGRLPAAVPAGP